MILVDTNVWSEFTRRTPDPAIVQWERQNADSLWLSVVVLAEFRAGGAMMAAGRARDAVVDITEAIATRYAERLLVFDEPCSREYGRVLASARAAGKPILTADAMIAATALANGMRVATRDVNDFAGAGVDIINPWMT